MPHADPTPEANFEALRQRLSSMRAERGWTYEELAERSGVSRASLVAIETAAPRGRRPLTPASRGSLDSWYRIAHAFGIGTGELLAELDS